MVEALDLSRYGEKFLRPETETAFQEDLRPRLASQLRFLAFLPAIYVSAMALDYQAFGNGGWFWILASLRLTVWGLIGISGFLARPLRSLRPAQAFLLAGVALVPVGEVLEHHLITVLQGPRQAQEIPFLVLFVLGVYIMLPMRLGQSLACGLWSSFFFAGYLALSGQGISVVSLQTLFLLFANGVGLAFRMTWERSQRRDFALRTRLEHEVAERKLAEEAAQGANAAKSRFLAVMSHEIRTPLNGVLGGVQLLQATPLLPQQRQPLEILATNGHLLARLLDDVLDMARIEAGHLRVASEPFALTEVLTSVHAIFTPQALAKGLALRLGVGADLPPALLGDALRLRQVLINLVGNAVKFTERGEVALITEVTESEAPPGSVRCAFTVRDSGPGLSEEAMARIFAPFEQGDMSIQRRHGGAGLGLAISRELTAAMGGELTLKSTLGKGSSFHFALILPRAQLVPQEQEIHPPREPLSILVVDDLEANRMIAAGLLENLGHHPRVVSGGAAALEALRDHRFDGILLDLHMQDMDGPEVLQRIRALPDPYSANLPVIICSADTERSRAQACLDAGAQGVLPKPIRKEQLLAFLTGFPPPDQRTLATPLIDTAQVAQIRADLGPETWARGLHACRSSAETCLAELEDEAHTAKALHRLAGLSSSYGMTGLHRLVRLAETQIAEGLPCPTHQLCTCCQASLEALENLEDSLRQASGTAASER